jgi:hypothetical protein
VADAGLSVFYSRHPVQFGITGQQA